MMRGASCGSRRGNIARWLFLRGQIQESVNLSHGKGTCGRGDYRDLRYSETSYTPIFLLNFGSRLQLWPSRFIRVFGIVSYLVWSSKHWSDSISRTSLSPMEGLGLRVWFQ